jgi:hypothetical protein
MLPSLEKVGKKLKKSVFEAENVSKNLRKCAKSLECVLKAEKRM